MDEFCFLLDLIFIMVIEDLISEFKQQYIIVIVIYNMQQVVWVSDQMVFFNLEVVGKLGWLVEIVSIEKIFFNLNQKVIEDYIFGCFGQV